MPIMPYTIRAILFDLDNTLYDAEAGLQDEGDRRITRWIMDQLGLPHDEADALRLRTWKQYGTTASGLEAEYGMDARGLYDATISRIEPSHHLEPWPELRAMLAAMSTTRHVFTNAPEAYAWAVLSALGVRDLFHAVFGIEYCDYQCKPNPLAYSRILSDLALPPEQVVFVEDNPGNLGPARELGMVTVLLGDRPGDADLRISSILQLNAALSAAGFIA